jgi:hydroxypyruvate isomerase
MKRRAFFKSGFAAAIIPVLGNQAAGRQGNETKKAFNLKYAPHFGMFKNLAGDGLTDQLKFAADQGFTAFEDNGMKDRPSNEQEKIAKTMQDLGMQMGVFVASATFSDVTFAKKDQAVWDQILKDIKESIEVAKRVNAKWMTVVPGVYDTKLAWEYQTANTIELLKRCCELLEPQKLVMVLEPLNHYRDHPQTFLYKSPQAYQICRAVNSPSCKILFDIYHQQISEGNLIPNIEMCWDQIGYFQIGDNPGRKEPGTGEINYKNVFKAIYARDYMGLMGMEHGNSMPGKKGDQAVLDAYRRADDFLI